MELVKGYRILDPCPYCKEKKSRTWYECEASSMRFRALRGECVNPCENFMMRGVRIKLYRRDKRWWKFFTTDMIGVWSCGTCGKEWEAYG